LSEELVINKSILMWSEWAKSFREPTFEDQLTFFELPVEGDDLFPVIAAVDKYWDKMEKRIQMEKTMPFRTAIMRGR
jgi:hypothetical protein